MDIGAIAQQAASTAQNNTGSALGATKLADTFDKFLTLLTTQLKHQDPLDPMKSAEFVNQLVQFTEVEQTISTNQTLEKLLDMQTKNRAISAVGLIGQFAEIEGRQLPLTDGAAEIVYHLPETSATTDVAVLNQAGQVVFSAVGDTSPGKHSIVWDGKDRNGVQLPDGEYTIFVSAKDAENNNITVPTGAVARVTGVETGADEVILSFGASRVPFDSVVAVKEVKSTGSDT